MMNRTRTLLLTAILLMGVMIVPPARADDFIRPTFRTEDVWFHCTGATKAYQANWVSGMGGNTGEAAARWDTTPPAQSVEEGAGCGAADLGGTTNSFWSPAFHGYVEGNLRDITVRLHHLLLGSTRQGENVELAVHLEIDGQPVFPAGPSAGGRVTVAPVPSDSGASEMVEFTITGLGFAEDVLDEDGNVVGVTRGGWAKEDGDGTHEHEVLLMVGLASNGQPGAWAWDTTEVPSGMTFNPEEHAAASLPAQLPN